MPKVSRSGDECVTPPAGRLVGSQTSFATDLSREISQRISVAFTDENAHVILRRCLAACGIVGHKRSELIVCVLRCLASLVTRLVLSLSFVFLFSCAWLFRFYVR